MSRSFVLVATGETDEDTDLISSLVSDTLESLGVTLTVSGWTPDLDTVADGLGVEAVELIEVTP